MRKLLVAAVVGGAVVIAAFEAQSQSSPTQPLPGADPYASNPAAGTQQFPLAAPAGKDSKARMIAPPGAVNQGPFDPATWKYGTAFAPPPAPERRAAKSSRDSPGFSGVASSACSRPLSFPRTPATTFATSRPFSISRHRPISRALPSASSVSSLPHSRGSARWTSSSVSRVGTGGVGNSVAPLGAHLPVEVHEEA